MSNKSSNNLVVPSAREAMDKFKMEAANDLAVTSPSYKTRETTFDKP